jgi:FkbM family methyltransferase
MVRSVGIKAEGTIWLMDLYGQEPEVRLLGSFLPLLEHRSVVDVGAERGAFVHELLRAGADEVYAIEPEPENAAFLKKEFAKDDGVIVHEYAISETDGELELHKSGSPSGEHLTFGHTMLQRPDTEQIAWHETVRVRGRSLSSLVDAREIPTRVGILKIDTEGLDLAVVAGMGKLEADVVMVEHWAELPLSLGHCPWSTEEMVSALRDRGFGHFAFVVHQANFVNLQWDDGSVPVGQMGNLVFLHDRVLASLLPELIECASSLVKNAIAKAEEGAAVAESLKVAEKLQILQAKASSQQLAAIEELKRERDLQANAAKERLAAIKKVERDLESQPTMIEKLKAERDLQAKAAEERLLTVEKLAAERDLQAKAAAERLATIKKLERDLDSQLKANEELKREHDLQANAAQERLALIGKLERESRLRLLALESSGPSGAR